jgi:hypothetical protein
MLTLCDANDAVDVGLLYIREKIFTSESIPQKNRVSPAKKGYFAARAAK